MNFIVLACAILATITAAVAVITRFCPTVRNLILGEEHGAERMHVLDGLRGVLAISVFAHHAFLAKSYYAGTGWTPPAGHFISQLGQVAVALFFMISAYLFWGRILARGGKMDWAAFFKGRWYRLAPMFYVSVAILFLFVALDSNFTLRVPLTDLLEQIGRWLCFALFGSPDINNLKDTYTVHSTVWTLKYEWIFYFALPVLAFLLRKLGRGWPIYLAIAIYSLHNSHSSMYAYFATGCVAVHILNNRQPLRYEKIIWAVLGIISLILLVLLFKVMMGPVQAVLLLPVFIAALQSIGPWRILSIRALRFMGHISYSFYLLHNLLIYAVAKWITGLPTYGALSPLGFYLVVASIGVAGMLLSIITFLLVEKPFLKPKKNDTAHPQGDPAQTAAAP